MDVSLLLASTITLPVAYRRSASAPERAAARMAPTCERTCSALARAASVAEEIAPDREDCEVQPASRRMSATCRGRRSVR